MSIELVMPSNHLIFCCCLLLLPCLSQHQGLFQGVGSLHQVAKVLEFQFQHQSFQVNIQGWCPLGLNGSISLLSKGLSRVFSSTIVWKHSILRCSALEDGKGQGIMACCSPWGRKELDTTEWLKNNSLLFNPDLTLPYTTTGKTIALTLWTFIGSDVSAF